MLDRVIRIVELCSCDPYPVLLTVLEHFLNPGRSDDLHIIVQEKKIFSTGFLHCKVIDGRIIELFLPGQDPYIVISAFECFVIGKGFLVFAVILYNKNLIILPGRSLLNRRNAQFQIIDMIFIWNDNGDQRLTLDLYMASVPSGSFCHFYGCRDSHSFVMCFYRSSSCLKCITFAFRVGCRGVHMGTPVVKDSRHMDNLFCLLTAAENQVKVLCTVIFRTEGSHLFQKLFFHCKDMADIIVLTQTEKIEIRLKVWFEIMFAVHADFIFVRVYHICFLLCDGFYNMEQCIRCQHIIMVAEHDIISHCQFDGCIGVLGNSLILFEFLVGNADFFFVFLS